MKLPISKYLLACAMALLISLIFKSMAILSIAIMLFIAHTHSENEKRHKKSNESMSARDNSSAIIYITLSLLLGITGSPVWLFTIICFHITQIFSKKEKIFSKITYYKDREFSSESIRKLIVDNINVLPNHIISMVNDNKVANFSIVVHYADSIPLIKSPLHLMANYYIEKLAENPFSTDELNSFELSYALNKLVRDQKIWPQKTAYRKLEDIADLLHINEITDIEEDIQVFESFRREYYCRTRKISPTILNLKNILRKKI
jgi:NADH:ubiquinone oxidoreductase subunit 5 (subunit L)/multisubunit Na+/H+ antiporter MnhA subunit